MHVGWTSPAGRTPGYAAVLGGSGLLVAWCCAHSMGVGSCWWSQPPAVVPGDPAEDRGSRLGAGAIMVSVDELDLEGWQRRTRRPRCPGTSRCGPWNAAAPAARRSRCRRSRCISRVSSGRRNTLTVRSCDGSMETAVGMAGRLPMRSPGRPPVARRVSRLRESEACLSCQPNPHDGSRNPLPLGVDDSYSNVHRMEGCQSLRHQAEPTTPHFVES